uniref:Uncharacterized protein n=1 Tax=Marmota marmota marmota TaxID=9994 RepID=A0A8C5Z5H0_MARMA
VKCLLKEGIKILGTHLENTSCPGTCNLPASASQVGGITGMCHHTWLLIYFMCKYTHTYSKYRCT